MERDSSDEDEVDSSLAEEGSCNRHRKRKATDTIRREEKERLMRQVEQMELKRAALARRLVRPYSTPGKTLQEKETTKRALEDTLLSNHFAILGGYIQLSVSAMNRNVSPVQHFIHLKSDPDERRIALDLLRGQKIPLAREFMQTRLGALDPTRVYFERKGYETIDGDYVSEACRILPFPDAPGVRRVFDALVYYFSNIEINISERLGSLTIREDDDSNTPGTMQNRLVTTLGKGTPPMESNTVAFSDFSETRQDGVVTADFVNFDDAHPYLPHERVRRDNTMFVQVASSPDGGVVIKRWSFAKIHRPQFCITNDSWHELTDSLEGWGDVLPKIIREL